MAKLTNTVASPHKPNDSLPLNSKEDVQVACDQSKAPSSVTNIDSSRPNIIQDDIDLGELRNYMEKHMEEDKVFDTNFNVMVTNNSSAHVEDNGSGKGSFLEQFLKSKEASKNKKHSLSDSDESEVEDVCKSDLKPGRGFLDCLEDDLDGYDGYDAQYCDLNEQGQAFCDQYDIY
uniref:Uncharacterized protein n=1 Tax=Tanacetum cinerariifolium TaxID=118510 RepID=A0A6L2M800_TANCI|nr:hypothetical protein [Tanacetum cinerariifolium]